MVSNRARATLVAAAIAVPVMALGGCGSSGKSSSPTTAASPVTTATSPASSSPSTASTPTTMKPVKLPTKFPNNPSQRKQVVLSSCASATGGWGAAGTAANTGTAATTYTITVYFTDTHATTLAYGQTKVAVPAGKSAKWKVAAKFAAPSKVLCVLVGAAHD